MKNNLHKLDFYLNLQYELSVVPLAEDGEFAFKAYSSDLDQDAFYGVGKTREDAIESFEEVRIELFKHFYEEDIPIPEPSRQELDLPSGRFLLRTSPYTHKKLIDLALKHRLSLNSMINQVLSEYTTSSALVERFAGDARESICAEVKRLGVTWDRLMSQTIHSVYSLTKESEYGNAA